MMKKHRSLLWMLMLMLVLGCAGCSPAADAAAPPQAVEVTLMDQQVITGQAEIEAYLAEYGMDVDPGTVEMIVDTTFSQDIGGQAPDGDGRYICKAQDSCRTAQRLLRSSTFAGPGGTMTIQEPVEIAYDTEKAVDTEALSAALGFDVTQSGTVTNTQTVEVPSGASYACGAYLKEQWDTFELWRSGPVSDAKVCDGSVRRPVGITFIISSGE